VPTNAPIGRAAVDNGEPPGSVDDDGDDDSDDEDDDADNESPAGGGVWPLSSAAA
jgi:hypothetical protein